MEQQLFIPGHIPTPDLAGVCRVRSPTTILLVSWNGSISTPAVRESVAKFLAQLRPLAMRCYNYDNSLESMLRDRLVCGINYDSIQKWLLTESNLMRKWAWRLRELTGMSSCLKVVLPVLTSNVKLLCKVHHVVLWGTSKSVT